MTRRRSMCLHRILSVQAHTADFPTDGNPSAGRISIAGCVACDAVSVHNGNCAALTGPFRWNGETPYESAAGSGARPMPEIPL